MRIGLRGAFGQSQITIDDSATVVELQAKISEASSLSEFNLLSGFPPKLLDLTQFDPFTKLSDTNLKLNGERIQVEPQNVDTQPRKASSATTPAKGLSKSSSSVSSTSKPAKQTSPRPKQEKVSQAPLNLTKKPNKIEDDPPELPIRNGESMLVHRVMPDDNSCLFRAMSKCIFGGDIDGMTELRSEVAQGIQADLDRYNAIVLEKEPDEYCRWIQNPNSWGGAIEIGILAERFNVEIMAVNVEDCSIQKFNEGQNHRAYLVYSGIHWDAIVANPVGRFGPSEFDEAQFDARDEEVLMKATEIGRILNKAGYYTDTQKFGIKCNTCGWKGQGEKGAIAHMQSTGHVDFGQVD